MYQSSDIIDLEYLVVCRYSGFRLSNLPVRFVLLFTAVLAVLLGTAVNNLYRLEGCALLQPLTSNQCQSTYVFDPIDRSLPSFLSVSSALVLIIASLRHI